MEVLEDLENHTPAHRRPHKVIADISYFAWPPRLSFEDANTEVPSAHDSPQQAEVIATCARPEPTAVPRSIPRSRRTRSLQGHGVKRTSDVHARTQAALLVHQPVSEEDHTIGELFAYQLFLRGSEESWSWYYYDSIPTRIGHEPCLDLASRAYIAATHRRRGTPCMTLRMFHTMVAKAIDSLQATLRVNHPDGVSDSVIQSVILHAAIEAELGEHNLLNPAHVGGLCG